jgi:hypothetical protein
MYTGSLVHSVGAVQLCDVTGIASAVISLCSAGEIANSGERYR